MGSAILIVDRQGFLGKAIFKKLPSKGEAVFIDEKKKIPKIPNSDYDYVFFIQNEKLEEKDLREEIIKKAKNDGARLIYILSLSKKTEQFIEKVKALHDKTSSIICGDLFGDEVSAKIDNTINRFLYQAKTNGVLKISGTGVRKIYPLFFEDAVLNIIKVAFLEGAESKTFFLFPKAALTEVSLAHLIQKKDPLIRLDFINEEELKKEDLVIPAKGEYLLEEAYPLREKLNISRSSLPASSPPPQKTSKTLFLFALLYFLFILVLPILLTLLSGFGGVWTLGKSRDLIKKADFATARKYASASKNLFSFAQKTSSLALFQANVIGRKEVVVGENIAQATVYSLDAFENFRLVFTNKSARSKEDFIEGLNKIKKAKILLQEINDSSALPIEIKKIVTSLSLVADTADILPEVFGFNSKKTYLVLFQNNMELRPGGGFIGSYGILKMNKGRIESFNIYDVYDADGQLKGHVEPPFAIRRYLPSTHWYLRDSNFSPDFVKSAEQTAFFLKQETNEIVDGAIGVDISFAKAILKATGEVYVADYKETVNSDNLYTLTQEYVQKDFFPGSSQKKDFLRSIFNAINESFSAKKDISYFSLLEETMQAVGQKHILFAFSDKDIQNVFTVNRLSSSLWDERVEEPLVLNDFVGISEANLGVNKVNYFVKRKIGQEVAISKEGDISEKLTISYQNQAEGDYKNYLRILLPQGAKLSSISIDGTEQTIEKAVTDPLLYEKKGFVLPNGLEVEEEEESGKTAFGFLVNIAAQSARTIEVFYQLPQKPISSAFSYSHWVFKQPGTEDDPYSFSLSYPEGFKILKGENPSFTKTLSEDINFKIDFVKK